MQPRMRYGGDAITIAGQGRAIAFAPGGKRLVALGNEHSLRVWDLPDTRPVRTVVHTGLGSHTALGFHDRDTAVVALDGTFARVHLREGRVEPIPGPPPAANLRTEGVVLSPNARFALAMRSGMDYVGAHSLVRVALSENAATERALGATSPREAPASTEAPPHVPRFNAAAVRDDGSAEAIGHFGAWWVLFRWNAAGELESITQLAAELERVASVNSHIFFPNALHLHPDGRTAIYSQGIVRVLDLETAEVLRPLEVTGEELSGDTNVDAGTLVRGGETFVAATRTGLATWDVASGELTKSRRFDERCFVLAAAVDESGALFAAADDRGVILHDLPGLTPAHSPRGHRNPPRVLALCPRGRHVASSDGSSLKMWHLASGELAWDRRLQVWAQLTFSPDGERLFADDNLLAAATGAALGPQGYSTGTAHAWTHDALVHLGYGDGGEQGYIVEYAEGEEMTRTGTSLESYLRCVPVLSANGARGILSSETVVYGYDMRKRTRIWDVALDVVSVALSPDGALAAVTAIGSNDVAIFDAATGARIRDLPTGRRGLIQTIAFGEGDRIAIPGDDAGCVLLLAHDRVHPERTPARLELNGGHTAKVCGLAFGPDGTDLVSSAEDGSISLWKL